MRESERVREREREREERERERMKEESACMYRPSGNALSELGTPLLPWRTLTPLARALHDRLLMTSPTWGLLVATRTS